MIKSMTGYGKGASRCADYVVSVEVRSVNHRFCDVGIKAPRTLLFLESRIKKCIGDRLRRGKIDVFINQDFAGGGDLQPNWNMDLAGRYVKIFNQIKNEFGLPGEVSLDLLVAQKDVINFEQVEVPQEELARATESALDEAIDGVQGMRTAEGEAILIDLNERLAFLADNLNVIEERAPLVPVEWREKFSNRLRMLERDNLPDAQKIAQEVAIFADRCDISEEITRFKSHLQQFEKLFAEEVAGRQMDFLVQELVREANTMGSKGNDALLSEKVVGLKAELEKIREQIQNVV
ncbi:MAG: YicC family protein [Deltaproteobacteria bacterium]|nr:YicC family protein [Deltaproteobacteria bacterium]